MEIVEKSRGEDFSLKSEALEFRKEGDEIVDRYRGATKLRDDVESDEGAVLKSVESGGEIRILAAVLEAELA